MYLICSGVITNIMFEYDIIWYNPIISKWLILIYLYIFIHNSIIKRRIDYTYCLYQNISSFQWTVGV